MWCAHAGIAAALMLVLVGHADAAEPPLVLVTEEFMVDAGDPGVRLYVRNKHPVDLTQVPAGHILLYVHGATQPSEATFDLSLEGISWMDYIASRGWDVYLMDARGYGGSTRSPEFAQPDAARAPIVSTDTKVRDAEAVIDFILERRSAPTISLIGWSWGTVVVASYATTHTDKVSSLVLYAPAWCEGPCKFDPSSQKRGLFQARGMASWALWSNRRWEEHAIGCSQVYRPPDATNCCRRIGSQRGRPQRSRPTPLER